MKRLSIAALLICGCLALSACGTAVPNVTGGTVVQARTAISAAGFTVGAVTYDETAPGVPGAVISQTPEPGTTTKAGSAVSLTLAGAPPVTVPALSGLAKAAAESALAGVGLTLGAVTESYDATIAVGMVTTQTPAPGLEAVKGSAVGLVLSKGREPVAVPKVVRKTKAAAAAALTAAGFKVKFVNKADRAKKGTVIGQTPASGTAKFGATITLTVSTGVVMVRVPSWRDFHGSYQGDDFGRVLESYKAALEAGFRRAGLVAVVEFHPRYWESVYQSPKPGSWVPKGTRVTIRVPVAD